jgi:hypothetical protein
VLSRRVALVTPSISAVASVSTAAQGAALGAMSATQAFGFLVGLVGPLLASYLYSIQHSLPLMLTPASCCSAPRWR